ncbi:MAG: hypothetical protein WDM92_02295 [Caulobacteraceae bacterium]
MRNTTCDGAGRFAFRALPAGGWFVVVVARPSGDGGESMAVMRRVTLRPGAVRDVVFGGP